jgi:hypothetical protein
MTLEGRVFDSVSQKIFVITECRDKEEDENPGEK